MGDYEATIPVVAESPMKHHTFRVRNLTSTRETGRGTLAAGQFDWGGFLLKSNGGALKVTSAWLAIMHRAYGYKVA